MHYKIPPETAPVTAPIRIDLPKSFKEKFPVMVAFSKYDPAPIVAPTTAPVIIPARTLPNIGARAANERTPRWGHYRLVDY